MPERMSSHDLVGRTAELDELTAALGDAVAGTPTTVFVGGEAGIGKTRLVTTFGERVAADARVLVGECLQLTGDGVPYAPFTSLFRGLIRDIGAAGVAGLAGPGAGVLARLLPELGEVDAAGDSRSAQARLFEHVLLLIESLARERPLVLVIEDAHWAGASTRDLLLFLVHSLRDARVLLLVTYRTDELHRTHPLRRLLAELERSRAVQRLELGRLSRDDVRELLTDILGAEPEPAQVEATYERTGGNPLFVEELVSCRQTDVTLLLEAGLSDSLRDLLLTRVERLPEPTQEVLRVAAVAGIAVEHELLAAVSGVADPELSAALRVAVEGNVLVADERGYTFRHALLREAVYEDLLPGERGRLHSRYATELTGHREPLRRGRAAAIAYHWYAAFDAERALAAAWEAAAQADRAAAYRDRLAMLERVLELWDRVPGAAELIGAERLDVLEAAVETAANSGDSERGVAIATAALEVVERAREPERAALLYSQRAKLRSSSGRGGAMKDLREAERLVRPLPPGRALAEVLNRMAKTLMLEPDDEAAYAYGQEALAIARAQGYADIEARTLSALASIEGHFGRIDAALAKFAEVRAMDVGVWPWLALDTNESDLLEGIGDHEKAIEVARAGLDRITVDTVRSCHLTANIAEPLISLGRWDEALALITEQLALEPPPSARGILMMLRARVWIGRGEIAAAARTAATVHALLAEGYVVAQDLLPLAAIEARVALAEGRVDDAADVVKRAMNDPALSRSRRYSWPILDVGARAVTDLRARADALRDDVTRHRADKLERSIRQRLGELIVVGRVEPAYRATVTAELCRGRGEADAALWRAAADAWRDAGQPYERAWASLRLAECLAAAGDRTSAAELIREVCETADALDARPLRLAADRLAARARVDLDGAEPVPPASDDGAARFGLTTRELEVLRLVAAGRTNRQIAAELFMSPKTASVHVSRISSKLGVHGRGEAAAAAYRLHLLDDREAGPHDAAPLAP
ncbi:MAG TPA: AAA family ATPase [Streptosporangiales bacterium]